MENNPNATSQNDIFSEEKKSFNSLVNLLNTYVGFNTSKNPWDNDMLEINP